MQAALCTATGAAASYGYLLWIMHDVDQVTGDDPTPMRDVDEIKSLIPRRIARALLGLRLSVTPRLLVRCPFELLRITLGPTIVGTSPLETKLHLSTCFCTRFHAFYTAFL